MLIDMKFPTLTTSDLGSVPGDIRINISRKHPLKFKRLFLGLHLDFSTHQMLLYMGIVTLFIELYGVDRKVAVIDKEKSLLRFKEFEIFYHDSNYSKHFFNIGITFYTNAVILFFWQLRFWVPLTKGGKS